MHLFFSFNNIAWRLLHNSIVLLALHQRNIYHRFIQPVLYRGTSKLLINCNYYKQHWIHMLPYESFAKLPGLRAVPVYAHQPHKSAWFPNLASFRPIKLLTVCQSNARNSISGFFYIFFGLGYLNWHSLSTLGCSLSHFMHTTTLWYKLFNFTERGKWNVCRTAELGLMNHTWVMRLCEKQRHTVVRPWQGSRRLGRPF